MYKIDNIEINDEQLDKLIAQREAIKYPIFKKSRRNGAIVKFKSLQSATVVWKGDGSHKIGHEANNFVEYTNVDIWEDVAYDSEKDLWDGQPVCCWSNGDTHYRIIRFYDAKNKCTFTYRGERNGAVYSYYTAVEPQHYAKWMIEAYKTLEDI